MPHSTSAKKALRANQRRRLRNRTRRSALRTQIKKFEAAVAEANVDAATEELKKTVRVLDQATAKKLMHKNTASRRKSQFMKRLNALVAGSKTE